MSETIKGHCNCGQVSVEVEQATEKLGACHCQMCRRWGGGPFLALHSKHDQVSFANQENISLYDSSDWAERGFCKNCGSNLFYRLKDNQDYYLSAGLFEQPDFNLDHQVFIDKKPDYYDFAQTTPCMTEAEVFAAFAGED